MQESLVAAIRRGAPLNTIIVTGEKWGGIDGLLELKPLADRNVIYSFHWYDPFTFTHQGASWAGPTQALLSDIPYPSSPSAVQSAVAAIADPKARDQVVRYGSESWNETRVRAGLARAAEWAAANHVPVFCGEFGVYRKVAPPKDRLRWISDVRRSLESLGIGWCMWDYETDFGLITFSEPGWRRGPQVDTGCLTALGLDATQTLEVGAGEGTAADFASGRLHSLDDADGIPQALIVTHRGARDWALNSGIQIPVKPGDELTLSSSASLEGTGSLRLELVARDAAGKILNWSFAAANVSAGPGMSVATRFTVPGGTATLEPRWSGSGPSRVLLKELHLERVRS